MKALELNLSLCFALLVLTGRAEQVAGWKFGEEGGKVWRANGDVKDLASKNGVLSCRTVGSDPIFTLEAPINFPALATQVVEVKLKADRDGEAELYFSNTREGKFQGFSGVKKTRFMVQGDNQWHVYRLRPYWQTEKHIVRLRLDLYDGTKYELDSLQVVNEAGGPVAAKPEFDFAKDSAQWRGIEGAAVSSAGQGMSVKVANGSSAVMAPPVSVVTDDLSNLAVRMSADKGRQATFLFASDAANGLQLYSFPIQADGREHTYNLDVGASPLWKGKVVAIGLRPSDAPGATVTLRWLKVSDTPQGPPQINVVAFAADEALPRAGRPVRLVARVANTGAELLSGLQAQLKLPAGVKLLASPKPEQKKLAFSEETELSWQVECSGPVKDVAQVEFAAAGADSVTAKCALNVTAALSLSKSSYVPEPKPVRGKYEVGVYYYPGWNSATRWQPLQNFPERKPVLGWYAEGSPEVTDWQIKWAVEHGITFFAYDWYWNKGARHLEHGLHDGFFKARYRNLLKFCLLWANHNPPKTSSLEDCVAVTRYWIENYFRRPEHLKIDGKPMVIIFSMSRLESDLGKANVKPALEAMRAECRKAGLPGLHVAVCVSSAGAAREAALQGYDSVTAYNWPRLGAGADEKAAPFASLIEGYRRNWEHIAAESPIPLCLPVCGGWDSRPWHGDRALVRFDRTPEKFEQHLADARQFLDARKDAGDIGRVALIEAWNEWGEGSYIEPHQQYGFGYLDAVRKVFAGDHAAHADLAPTDVGLGPYDVPAAPPARTAWTFDANDEGWNSVMQIGEVKVQEGALTGKSLGKDPAFFGPPMQARAEAFSRVVLRMKLEAADGQPFQEKGQLFWKTTRAPESEASSVRWEVNGDGQWHDYTVPLNANKRWKGIVTQLRFDPCNRSGVKMAVDYLRLEQ